MLPPLIHKGKNEPQTRSRERGFTMALVTLALFAIVGMAALSIDIGTLYQAKAEAQRAADAAALAAARVISISGITGDAANYTTDGSWALICNGAGSPASLTAITVAQQNQIAGAAVPATSVTVTYGASSGGGSNTDCSALGTDFAVNPLVTVNVQRANLPIFFARVFSMIPGISYSGTGVNATATAEAFNPSDSGKGAAIFAPVQPRCVKPWVVPNTDPGNSPNRFVHLKTGRIWNDGILEFGSGAIGESFALNSDCKPGNTDCLPASGHMYDNPPQYPAVTMPGGGLEYIPALLASTAPGAVPACSTTNAFQQAIGGCDQSTVYTCGTVNSAPGATQADLTENPGYPTLIGGDTATAAECLIHQSPGTGADSLAGATPPAFPFQILAGGGSPLVTAGLVSSGDRITTSDSIVTIPIAEFGGGTLTGSSPTLTIVGFLQVFINSVNTTNGSVNVTVLNISGCGDEASTPPLFGTSPVPVRLITPP